MSFVKFCVFLASALVSWRVCAIAPEFDPAYDLYPGLEFSVKVKLDVVPDGGAEIFSRSVRFPGGYLLRVDSASEGSKFSFFVNLNGKIEPRVRSAAAVRPGVWYAVKAGWDGEQAYLEVDGVRSAVRRRGRGVSRVAKLKLGGKGVDVKEFRFRSAPQSPDDDLNMAKGFRMSCSVTFDEEPFGLNELVCKKGGYLLRYDRQKRGSGAFRFWPDVDGKWEPSVGLDVEAEAGKRYDIAVQWDGVYERIAVNGMTAKRARSGKPRSLEGAVRSGRFQGTVSNLVIRPVSSPNAFFAAFRSRELMPRFGEKCRVCADVCNIGSVARDCKVVAESDAGIEIEPREIAIGDLVDGARVPLEWKVNPGKHNAFGVRLKLVSEQAVIATGGGWLTAMPHKNPDMSAKAWSPPIKTTRCYFIDSKSGDDARSGLSEAEAWKSFANLRAITLGPGERLKLKRGSVFNEELVIAAAGKPGNWAEIGAYGKGPRPHIRRNRNISERAAYILSPRYLAVRDLVVCNAGKGLVIDCADDGSGHVLVERCLAHHIEGLYRMNSHGIPEWFGRDGAPGGARGGIAVCGAAARDIVMRDSEMYQCSNGFFGQGRDVWFGRLFCHDNFCHNTSPHPVFTSTVRAWLIDSVFDSAGWNATWGTMGIMFSNNRGLVVKGCHFVNMRDSGSGDGGGIDFECYGDNALVEECTFRNNAGAAIEFLGFSTPQAHNTHIRRCRFERNNFALRLGPSEIYVHGANDNDRKVVDASGTVEGNGYVLNDGVTFFTNISAVTRGDWTVRNNRRYATWKELAAAMPFGEPPEVSAAKEIWTDLPEATISANVGDADSAALEWEQLEGPAISHISSPRAAESKVALPKAGDYTFLVKADNGRYWRSARTAVHRLEKGRKVLKAWTFAENLNCEGWTFADLGTRREKFLDKNGRLLTYANPVNLVCGDYFVLAVKAAGRARIESPCDLNVSGDSKVAFTIKMHNATNSSRMRLCYISDDSPQWSNDKSIAFEVTPKDKDDSVYEVDIPFTGKLRRIRLEFSADSSEITGTCRIDYIHISSASH